MYSIPSEVPKELVQVKTVVVTNRDSAELSFLSDKQKKAIREAVGDVIDTYYKYRLASEVLEYSEDADGSTVGKFNYIMTKNIVMAPQISKTGVWTMNSIGKFWKMDLVDQKSPDNHWCGKKGPETANLKATNMETGEARYISRMTNCESIDLGVPTEIAIGASSKGLYIMFGKNKDALGNYFIGRYTTVEIFDGLEDEAVYFKQATTPQGIDSKEVRLEGFSVIGGKLFLGGRRTDKEACQPVTMEIGKEFYKLKSAGDNGVLLVE